MITGKLEVFLLQQKICIEKVSVGVIDLAMTERGWREAQPSFPKQKGVYIHVSSTGIPLRVGIGLGKEGVYGRWFHSRSCHFYAFRQKKDQRSNYRQFFQLIQFRYLQTYVLYILMDPDDALRIEKALRTEWLPLWEIQEPSRKYVFRDQKYSCANPCSLEMIEYCRDEQVAKIWQRI